MRRSMRTRKAAPRGFRPGLEAIEARLVLSTLLASPTIGDGGPGSLRAAITTANNENSNNVLILATPGTYLLSEGELEVAGENITIKPSGVGAVTIVASSGDRIFEVETGTLTLDNLTMRDGHLDDGGNNGGGGGGGGSIIVGPISPFTGHAHPDETDSVDGGAILNDEDSTLYVNNCTFSNNNAIGTGGAIANEGSLYVNNSTFSNNSAFATMAGGGAISNFGPAIITNSTFTANVSDGIGGAILNDDVGSSIVVEGSAGVTPANIVLPVTVVNCQFSGNSAIFGGAIANLEAMGIIGSSFTSNLALETGGAVDNNGGIILSGSTFTTNTAGQGGGIENAGSLSVVGATFTGNTSEGGGGGGIFNGDSLAVRGSTFQKNTANDGVGGGISNADTLSVTGSSFLANYATYTGSAVYDAPASTAVLSASTFIGNSSAQYLGYAIENDSFDGTGSTLTMTSCLVTLNDGGVANEVDSTLNLNGCMMVDDANDDCLNNGTANVSLTFTYINGTGTVNDNP